jgi:hypothetical protein
MKSPAPSTYNSVLLAKQELRLEIIEVCQQIAKIKDIRKIVFVAKIPPKQVRNYIQLPDGTYDAKYKRKNYAKQNSDRPS